MSERLKVEMEAPEGLQIAEGFFKTGKGTIRIPRSRMKEEAKKAQKDSLQRPELEPRKEPVKVREQADLPVRNPRQLINEETVTFSTPVGELAGVYDPVIELDSWLVLGKTPQSFVPKSYNEDPELTLTANSKSVKACKVVYTGCQFSDPHYPRTYLIFMKRK